MEKGQLGVCLALCAILHVLSAAVIKPEQEQQKLLVQKKYGHLQVEIDEWRRLGKPTVAAFPTGEDGASELGLLVDMPLTASIFSTDYDNNVFFYLFTRENPNGTEVAPNAKSFSVAGWDPKRPTKIAIHGFSNTISSPMFTTLVPSLLGNQDCNVVGVDWGKLCKSPFYIEARNHVEGVGKVVAKLVDKLVSDGGLHLDDLHVMGHSLGAHVSGCTGKHIKSGKIGRITGMDPAMPLFLLLKSDRLNKNDAKTVDVIHTCGGMLGLVEAIGTVDFYPNGGGHPQPGCGIDLVGSCSHARSYEYMGESAVEVGAFPATECETQGDAIDGTCTDLNDGYMGLNLVFNKQGTKKYHLETASSSPYDLNTHRREASENGDDSGDNSKDN